MSAEGVIAEMESLSPTERAKVFAYVNDAMAADDSWIPEPFGRAWPMPKRDISLTWRSSLAGRECRPVSHELSFQSDRAMLAGI